MKKIKSDKSDTLILLFCIKSILSSVASILLFSFVSSKIIFALDLDIVYAKYFSAFICCLCACLISFVSVYGFKNNGLLLGAFSEIPLLFYSLINVIFNNNYILFFIIKFILIVLFGMLIGHITVRKTRKIKVR